MGESTDKHNASQLNQAVAQGGAYEIIQKRLLDQGQVLEAKLNGLNDKREAEFGKTKLEVIARIRVRTENNCVPRDIVRINNTLLFGYNVFIGLKKETKVEDVFSLYELKNHEAFDVTHIPIKQTFLSDPKFIADFQELYAYYKHTKLIQLQNHNQKLLATFQIGNNISDIRVFRWALTNSGEVRYIDNRGERDVLVLPSHDFEWRATSRDDQILGKHSHISILDQVFVETINGNLTIKVENNTEDGFGVYQESVDDPHQSLDDAEIYYAQVGTLLLLKIKPYREQKWRYLVFNTRTKEVVRIDAIGDACISLPEDHGIIFPGGCYLQNGEVKIFEDNTSDLKFKRKIHSPNGEDVLYVFYAEVEGLVALFSYNLIRKELQNPIYAHGYCLFDDGKAVIFRSESAEATRNHPMQIWQTPFFSDEYALTVPANQSFLGKIGNAELVRGISDLYSVKRAIAAQNPSMVLYEDIIATCQRVFDSYFWLDASEVGNLAEDIKSISETAELVLDEFEKVESIQTQAQKALLDAKIEQQRIIKEVHIQQWKSPQQYVNGLMTLRKQLGHLQTIRELRYIDLAAVETLAAEVSKEQESLGVKTIQFLTNNAALQPYHVNIEALQEGIVKIGKVVDLKSVLSQLDEMGKGLDLLTETLGTIAVDDATKRTAILESISSVYAKLNQTKAHANIRRKELGTDEAVAEFSAQFTLLSQSITSALSVADTLQKCDEQLSRLSVQLEELEGKFSEYDEFLADILTKREELYETFESKKQALLDEQHRRAHNLVNAADRIFSGIQRRSLKFTDQDELNTYFSADAMVQKIKELVSQLRKLNDNVSADDLESRLKSAKEQAIRALRDKKDIFEDGGNVIKLGKHRFSVNTQELDMTLVKRGDALAVHLTGTDYVEEIKSDKLAGLMRYWDQPLISESAEVYRAEYLAAQILLETEKPAGVFSFTQLLKANLNTEEILSLVRQYASPRYQEGYEKGVHDVDCVKILNKILPLRDQAGLLRYAPKARSYAVLFWSLYDDDTIKQSWQDRAHSAKILQDQFAIKLAFDCIGQEIQAALTQFLQQQLFPIVDDELWQASEYLVQELATEKRAFITSGYASSLAEGLLNHLDRIGHQRQYLATTDKLQHQVFALWSLSEAWLNGYVQFNKLSTLARYIPEANAMLIAKDVDRQIANIDLVVEIDELLGDHPRIKERKLTLCLDEFEERLKHFHQVECKAYKAFQQVRQSLLVEQKKYLRLETFKARPLSSFVRNKLINEVYLPIIGDNLAKQMGTIGDSKRTDLMGLLLLISPPGYGKTTLMEYMADRLGLIFVKINCPSLGHDVRSLDPANAPNATAKQELEKLNLALEMGSNVMLYLDDIQHTHAEFLQKFISLCDGTRRIEGVWKNQTKTYDLRGKKFCVIMAGNPYTESGDLFKIPDMLANRADVYNLGDVLSGRDEVFALSYIENSLTSNPVLAPLATREMTDVYKLINMAKGENIANTELSHTYSGAEISEIKSVIKKLFVVQNIVLKVNQAYIASAATAEKYRTEPAFKLQGSYRNMNKMAEKIVAVMNDKELQEMISDHYLGEAQLLTSGAEENLLKLNAIKGSQTPEQQSRWQAILKDYARIKAMGGEDADGATKVANQIANLSDGINAIHSALHSDTNLDASFAALTHQLSDIRQILDKAKMDVQVINQPIPGIEKVLQMLAETIDTTFMPVVKAMNHKIDLDLNILHKVSELSSQLRQYTSKPASTKKDGESAVKKSPAPPKK